MSDQLDLNFIHENIDSAALALLRSVVDSYGMKREEICEK
jgi:hypothetical protein